MILKIFEKVSEMEHGKKAMIAVLTIILTAIIIGCQWFATVCIIKLITLCFGWEFTWLKATGAYLCIVLLSSFFTRSRD